MSLAYTDILYCFYRAYTVNLRISARGAYLKFRRTRGRLFEGGAYLIFQDHFSDTLSSHKHQHKLFVDKKADPKVKSRHR